MAVDFSLIDSLRGRSAPLAIELDDFKCIVAASYDYRSPYRLGLTFHHPEGDICIGTNGPTRAARYHLDLAQLAMLSYDDQAALVIDALGLDDFEDCPWVLLDKAGEVISQTRSSERLHEWLNEDVDIDEAIDNLSKEISPYLPGFDIMRFLEEDERTRLGLELVDIGGMGSSGCLAVRISAAPEALSAALLKAGLPFRLTADLPARTGRRPQKWISG